MADNQSKAFINPQRMATLGLSHLVSDDRSSYGSSSSSFQTPQPYRSQPSQGQQYSYNAPSHPPLNASHSSKSFTRSNDGPANPYNNNNGRAPPAKPAKRSFGYDDRVRPRPRRPDIGSNWDRVGTLAELQHIQAHMAGNNYSMMGPGSKADQNSGLTGSMLLPSNIASSIGESGSAAALGLLPSSIGGSSSYPTDHSLQSLSSEPSVLDRQAYRVYVGGLNGNVNEQDLRHFIQSKLLSIKDKPTPNIPGYPSSMITSVQPRGTFAFVEFADRIDTEACFSLDGVTFQNIQLKIKPPKEMVQYYESHPVRRYAVSDAISSNVPNTANKIFLGNIPPAFTDKTVLDIVQSIGPLSAFNLVKNQTGSSRGYAFFTFADESITEQAINNLNGLQVEPGRTLTCTRANSNSGSQGTPAPIVAPSRVDKFSDATKVIVLHNVGTAEELEAEGDDILLDINDECSKFGRILSSCIHDMCVYVYYESLDDAIYASEKLNGRVFGPSTLRVTFCNESAYLSLPPRTSQI